MNAMTTAIHSQPYAMKTITTTTSLWLLAMALVLAFLCEDVHGAVAQVKQGKPKNSTVAAKESSGSSATSKPKHGVTKPKTTTSSPSTTVKAQKHDPPTSKPLLDIDGRNAYVNNRYVSEQEPIPDNTPPLYEILQKQMENVLSNTGFTSELYSENPQSKEMPDDVQHAPAKPMFSYNMNHFNDYDEESENEEDLGDQEEQQQPENCEDTEESLNENDDNNSSPYGSPISHPSNGYQQNNPTQGSYKPPPHMNTNKPGKDPYDAPNYNTPTSNYGQPSKPSSSNHYNKPPQSSSHATPSHHKPSHSMETPKPSQSSHYSKPTKPAKHTTTASQPSTTTTPSKPNPSKPNPTTEENPISNSPSSPFSTTYNRPNKPSSTSRHVTFRTISSSTQYLSSPLADLMLKISIGMAKPQRGQSDLGPQENQVYDKNDIELKAY
ncbi:uncharacterized protein LOC142234082 [Haematobia irritans]|uniref:uncharacterized protein LOC142234082 n=1 Tax=Haematobia irritans TaxID=7368 RepID=UPI003F5070EA